MKVWLTQMKKYLTEIGPEGVQALDLIDKDFKTGKETTL